MVFPVRNLEKMTFWLFWWNWEKSLEIESKPCFNADSVKIWSFLSEILRKWLFDFFDETGKNYQKSWEKNCLMLIQTKYGQFCHIWGGMNFFNFFDETGEIIRNREKSMFWCWFRQIKSILSCLWWKWFFEFFNGTEFSLSF